MRADDLFGPPLTVESTGPDEWLVRSEAWPLLHVDLEGVAVNDLRSSVLFAHRVWFGAPRLEPGRGVEVVQGARCSRVMLDGRLVAEVAVARSQASHAEVKVFDPATAERLFDREVRFRQLQTRRTPSRDAQGLGR